MHAAEFVAVSAPDIHFDGTEFNGDLSLRDANFRSLCFQSTDDSEQVCRFPAHKPNWWNPRGWWDDGVYPKVDLRGLIYERIDSSKALEALRFLEPFDLQPFRQAERVLRTMGKARAADKAYLIQRWRTLRYHLVHPIPHLLRALGELVYWALANFGVRPYRLALFAFILIGASMWQFARPAAVMPKKDQRAKQRR